MAGGLASWFVGGLHEMSDQNRMRIFNRKLMRRRRAQGFNFSGRIDAGKGLDDADVAAALAPEG